MTHDSMTIAEIVADRCRNKFLLDFQQNEQEANEIREKICDTLLEAESEQENECMEQVYGLFADLEIKAAYRHHLLLLLDMDYSQAWRECESMSAAR